MTDISVQNVKKAFEEGVDILDGLSFDITEGEHVGLLGKNGAGKTTLFKLLAGELSPDEGEIVLPSFKKVGLISQIPQYPPDYSAEDVLRAAFTRLRTIKTEMESLEAQMSGGSEDGLKAYDRLAFEFERLGGYNTEFELNRVANGLRIPPEQRAQMFASLSGGEKTRVNLARLILENTDILLLDEPTNHLDMRAAEWLEDFLSKYKGTVLVISHDRYFLDRTINRAIEINAGKAEFYSGNYSYYVEEKQRRYLEQFEKYEREQRESKRLRDAADRLHQWGTGNKALMRKSQAIERRAERVLQTGRPARDRTMKARISEREFHGDEVLTVRGLSKSYGGRKLLDIPELDVRGGERIALIGDNGTGKTTLVRLITGQLKPDSGFARRGPSVKPAYLPQHVEFPNPHRTLLDTLIYDGNCDPQSARNRLGAFLFSGEDVFKRVEDLSGGEKSRLRLCMLMNDDINFLILDEPTNHLDIASREWMESAVEGYGETLLFISHDRYFINKLATRIWALEDGTLTDFQGTFSAYSAFKAAQVNQEQNKKEPAPREKHTTGQKRIKPSAAQKELRRVEREIEKLEAMLTELEVLRGEHSSDYERLMELDERERELQESLDALLAEWELLAE